MPPAKMSSKAKSGEAPRRRRRGKTNTSPGTMRASAAMRPKLYRVKSPMWKSSGRMGVGQVYATAARTRRRGGGGTMGAEGAGGRPHGRPPAPSLDNR